MEKMDVKVMMHAMGYIGFKGRKKFGIFYDPRKILGLLPRSPLILLNEFN